MPKKAKNKGFFALDIYQFKLIRQNKLGIEEAATYLALLKSTDQSNVISSGGVRSVMDYSGLTRAEVKRSIRNLEGIDLIKCLKVERIRARKAERYNLPIHDTRRSLSTREQAIVDHIKIGEQPVGQSELQAAHRASAKGWIEKRSDEWQVIEHSNTVAFIPNSFVKTSKGDSPLHRLISGGELGPIMLAMNLYQIQNLMDERGVPLDLIRGHFHASADLGIKFDQHQLHYLRPDRTSQDNKTKSITKAFSTQWWDEDSPTFWNDLQALDAVHVTEWAVYSTNGQTAEHDKYAYKRPQRPLGVLRNGQQVSNTPESRAAFMAFLIYKLKQTNGQKIESLPQLIKEWRTDSPVLAFENAAVSHVEGVSILRLAHRAETDNTKVWYRELCEECDKSFLFMEMVAQTYFPQRSDIIKEILKSEEFN